MRHYGSIGGQSLGDVAQTEWERNKKPSKGMPNKKPKIVIENCTHWTLGKGNESGSFYLCANCNAKFILRKSYKKGGK